MRGLNECRYNNRKSDLSSGAAGDDRLHEDTAVPSAVNVSLGLALYADAKSRRSGLVQSDAEDRRAQMIDIRSTGRIPNIRRNDITSRKLCRRIVVDVLHQPVVALRINGSLSLSVVVLRLNRSLSSSVVVPRLNRSLSELVILTDRSSVLRLARHFINADILNLPDNEGNITSSSLIEYENRKKLINFNDRRNSVCRAKLRQVMQIRKFISTEQNFKINR